VTHPRENLTRDDARTRAALLADVEYDVTLDLDRGDDEFLTDTVITFTCREPGASTFVDLTAVSFDEIELNGRPVGAASIQPTRVTLDGLEATNRLRIRATMPYQHEGKGLHFFRDPTDGRVYLHSQFEPFDAHRVYPCFDQPDLKAPFRLTVEAPADWVVVSNAAVTSRPEDGAAGRWTFAPTPRVSPYITAIVAGGYASVHDRHGDVDLGIYIRRSLLDYLEADELFELTKQGLDWFNANFGRSRTPSASTTSSSSPSSPPARWRTRAASPSPSRTSSVPA
jgi:aminopeptidase N